MSFLNSLFMEFKAFPRLVFYRFLPSLIIFKKIQLTLKSVFRELTYLYYCLFVLLKPLFNLNISNLLFQSLLRAYYSYSPISILVSPH